MKQHVEAEECQFGKLFFTQRSEFYRSLLVDYKLDDEEDLIISYCAAKVSQVGGIGLGKPNFKLNSFVQDRLNQLSEIIEATSTTFADHLQKALAILRHQRLHIVEHLCECRKILLTSLNRTTSRQAFVDSWQKVFLQ